MLLLQEHMHWRGWHIWSSTMLALIHSSHIDVAWSKARKVSYIVHMSGSHEVVLVDPIHVKSVSVHHVWKLVVLRHFHRSSGWVVSLSCVVYPSHTWNVRLHHWVRVHHVWVVHPLAISWSLMRVHVHSWMVTSSNGTHTNLVHTNRITEHTMCRSRMSKRTISTSMSGTAWVIVIETLFLQSQIDVACTIDILHL
jgi:hypothetical protein